MSLAAVVILAAAALLGRLVFRSAALRWYILGFSALSLFLLQPALPIRRLDFWLPLHTIALTALVWAAVTPRPVILEQRRENLFAIALLLAVPLAVSLLSGLQLPISGLSLPLATQPGGLAGFLLVLLALLAALSALPERFKPLAWSGAILILLALFLISKVPALSQQASHWLRVANAQSPANASPLDLRWLGYSYVAFRLIHILRDRQASRLQPVSLVEFASYVLFFPALAAGPIDRLERFTRDLRQTAVFSSAEAWAAGSRILRGLVKKFVVADFLSRMALSIHNMDQAQGIWLWVLIYGYALLIYFDFSGYTDLAIGSGRLLGIQLPENFNQPYLKPNLTQFWNNWHMTLTQWFRGYFFNPLTRWLRKTAKGMPAEWSMLLVQVATMVLIGLWHGVTWNFAIWGLWHGLGLFLQNRWSQRIQPLAQKWSQNPTAAWLLRAGSPLLTFHYVALGWVWFALPDPRASLQVFSALFGLGGGG